MTEELTDERRLMGGKLSIPSDLRSAEWARVPQWERERAFYMAGVFQSEILDAFRAEVELIAQGDRSIPESERRLREFLDGIGYAAEPGQEGTIKDLRHWRRMRVTLRTNAELLSGWAQKERGAVRGAAMAFPAWELVRVMPRSVPRDWEARWILAGGEDREKDTGGRMIALKTDPVWARLGSRSEFEDALGVDYPPFAWGSGMGWRAVGFREADALGVIPDGWTPPPRVPVSSPNENLQMTPRVSEPALREALAERMKGLAEWEDDALVFTDPNGTRKMTGGKLTEVWAKGIPQLLRRTHKVGDATGDDEGLPQRLALQLWSENHDNFKRETDPKTGLDTKPVPGRLDLYDDLLRLFARITPMPGNIPVYRGMAWQSRDGMENFLEGVRKSKTYAALPSKPADSWSVAASGARKYEAAGKFSVRLVCEEHHSAKDLSSLLRSIQDRLRNPDPKHPLVTDGEVIFAGGARFELIRIERATINQKGGEATLYVRQL